MTDCCKKELINEKCIGEIVKKELINEKCIGKIVKKELFVEIRVSVWCQ